nr:Chain B, Chitinase [Paenibacillus sp. FPU-7]
SVHMNDSVIGVVYVDKKDTPVRIVAKGSAKVGEVIIAGSVKLEETDLTGTGFEKVVLKDLLPANAKVTLSGSFTDVDVAASANPQLNVNSGTIERLTVAASSKDAVIVLASGVKVTTLTLNIKTQIKGQGSVGTAVVNLGGKGSSFESAPGKTEGIAKDSVTTGGSFGGGGYGGGSGSSSNPVVKLISTASNNDRQLVLKFNAYGWDNNATIVLTSPAGKQTTYTYEKNSAQFAVSAPEVTFTSDKGLAAGTWLYSVKTAKGSVTSDTVTGKAFVQGKIVSYIPAWVDWAKDERGVDATKFTHLYYAFGRINNGKVVTIKEDAKWTEDPTITEADRIKRRNNPDESNLAYLTGLKAKNPNLKVLVSIGGWEAEGFSDAALTPESREVFANSALDFMNKYNLDGIDLDWEYPVYGAWGVIKSRPEDKANFTALLKLLREKLDAQSTTTNKYYELAIAAGASKTYTDSVELTKITPYLDYINLMTYDLHGGWDPATSHHTAVYSATNNQLSVDSTVKLYLNNGVPAEKLMVGGAFYSRVWQNVENKGTGLSEKAGSQAGSPGTIVYSELVNNYINKNGYTRYWDDTAKAPYLFNGSTFISYEDTASAAYKAEYIKQNNLAGFMYWEYSQDSDSHELANTIYSRLYAKSGTPLSVGTSVYAGTVTMATYTQLPAGTFILPLTQGTLKPVISASDVTVSGIPAGITYTVANAADHRNAVAVYVNGGTVASNVYDPIDVRVVVKASAVLEANMTDSAPASVTIMPKFGPILLGYVPGWVDWTNSAYKVDATKLTHINYAFARIKDNKVVKISEDINWVNEFPSEEIREQRRNNPDDANFAYLKTLKQQNPSLKVLVSIGGWAAEGFSDAALTPETREELANSAIAFMHQYGFDGIDLDWEYPVYGAFGVIKSRPEDKQNFTALLKLFREKLDVEGALHGKYYELAIASAAAPIYINSVELDKIHQYLDYMSVMTYDYHGSWESKTAHQASVYTSALSPGDFSADSVLTAYRKQGVPASKLVIGGAFYARGWVNVPNINHGLFQQAGDQAKNPGTPTYNDLVKDYFDKGYTRYWDNSAKAPYLYNPDANGGTFITYDDEESLKYKAEYAKNQGLRGVMFWDYSQDISGKLLGAIFNELKAPK